MGYVIVFFIAVVFLSVAYQIAKPCTPHIETKTTDQNEKHSIFYSPLDPEPDEKINNVEIPENILFDKNGLPYKVDKKYRKGWGKQFNAFVTPHGEYYHKSKCRCCKTHNYQCIHVYTALSKGYKPCKICKPKPAIDDWYIDYLKSLRN